MKYGRHILVLAAFIFFAPTANSQNTKLEEDFEYFWRAINSNYAYFDKKQTDWEKVREIYLPKIREAKTGREFVRILELCFRELYDNHAQLNTNLPDSSRLIPSGADIWADWKNGKAHITNLRRGFGAENSGLKIGSQITHFNGVKIENAIQPFIGKSLKAKDNKVNTWALNALLAGDHKNKRVIRASFRGKTKNYNLDEPTMMLENVSYSSPIESKIRYKKYGYIKINNSLGNNSLIGLFDKALDSLLESEALVLDLRETPSGGNSTVGRAILSRFISKRKPFQMHSRPFEKENWGVERSWLEMVSPRGKVYDKPLVILVNRWTGSMGEGIAIGFHGMGRAKIIGTKMAALNGGMATYTLPNTNIKFSFPVEKIFTVNGLPREDFVPDILVDLKGSKIDRIFRSGIASLFRTLSN